MTDRLAELSAGLAELGCEALLVLARSAQDPDLAPFTGAVHVGECQLVAPRGGPPRLAYFTAMERDEAAATGLDLITPEDLDLARRSGEALEPQDVMAEVAEKALARCGIAPGRIALAGNGAAGVIQVACARLAKAGWTFVPGNALALAVRKRKTPAEVAAIRAVAEGTCAAMRAVAALLAQAGIPSAMRDSKSGEAWLEGEPLRVARLRAEVAQVFSRLGLEQPKGNMVAPAEEGAVPHSTGTDERILRAGESLVVDLFPHGTMFADCTRVFCVGEPPPTLVRARAAVLSALERAHLCAVPGVRGWEIQESVCDLFTARGYPTPIANPGTTTGYVHNLGHGVGFEIHEHPIFKKATGAEGVLREGDVFTLEPGLYDPAERWGVRLEDLVWLGPEGLENLTPLPYDLDPRAWLTV